LVEIYHKSEAATTAQAGFEKQFSKRETPDEVPQLLIESSGDREWLPRVIAASGVVESNSAAIRLIRQGGIKINGETISDKDYHVSLVDGIVIKIGKKHYFRLGKK